MVSPTATTVLAWSSRQATPAEPVRTRLENRAKRRCKNTKTQEQRANRVVSWGTTSTPHLRGRELRLRPGPEVAKKTGRPHSPWLRLGSLASTGSTAHPSSEGAANTCTPLPKSDATPNLKHKPPKHRRPTQHGRSSRKLGRKTVVKGDAEEKKSRFSSGQSGESDFGLVEGSAGVCWRCPPDPVCLCITNRGCRRAKIAAYTFLWKLHPRGAPARCQPELSSMSRREKKLPKNGKEEMYHIICLSTGFPWGL
ncbi:uncharacterized protein [Symphalangus syndactylus]|uniref:uncharacterized protein n=1 Tax=Symphalangus syndactylus TaxID=9590 RepID=UPI003006E005